MCMCHIRSSMDLPQVTKSLSGAAFSWRSICVFLLLNFSSALLMCMCAWLLVETSFFLLCLHLALCYESVRLRSDARTKIFRRLESNAPEAQLICSWAFKRILPRPRGVGDIWRTLLRLGIATKYPHCLKCLLATSHVEEPCADGSEVRAQRPGRASLVNWSRMEGIKFWKWLSSALMMKAGGTSEAFDAETQRTSDPEEFWRGLRCQNLEMIRIREFYIFSRS